MIPQTAANPAEDYLDGLGGQAAAALVMACRGDDLESVGVLGNFKGLDLARLVRIPAVNQALERGSPWIGKPAGMSTEIQDVIGRPVSDGHLILWPLVRGSQRFGLVYLEPKSGSVDAELLALLARLAGRLTQRLQARLHGGVQRERSQPPQAASQSTGRFPADSNRQVLGADMTLPVGGGEVSDARLLLNMALVDPTGVAAEQLEALDAYVTGPLLARFLDTELEHLLPVLGRMPLSRRRVIRILVTSEEDVLRQEALHCLERWPDHELCRPVSPDSAETSLARELLPLAFADDRSLAASVSRVLEKARHQQHFGVEVLAALRELLLHPMIPTRAREDLPACRGGGQHFMVFLADHRRDAGSIMMSYQCRLCRARIKAQVAEDEYERQTDQLGRAIELLARFRDADCVPELIPYLDHDGLQVRVRQALVELTLVGRDWRRSQWERWWRQHHSRGRQAWIIDGLDHWDSEIRSQAVAELYAEAGDNFGFRPEANRSERKEALKRVRASLLPQVAPAVGDPSP